MRSAAEYRQGHIQGALLMPHLEIGALITEAGIDRETPITVYCQNGRCAEIARQTLREQGYSRVTNGGGFTQLSAQLSAALQSGEAEVCEAGAC